MLPVPPESSVVLEIADDASEKGKLDYPESVTVSVSASVNNGFWGGTLYFDISDNLEPDTASVFGKEVTVSKCIDEASNYYGFYAVPVIYEDEDKSKQYTETDTFCSVTFAVTGIGSAHIECIPYDMVKISQTVSGTTEPVDVAAPEKLEYTVNTPAKPVIAQGKLPDAVLNNEYSQSFSCDYEENVTWAVSEGVLPDGITFDADGNLTGTPTNVGNYTFKITATLLDSIVSDPLELTLTVLEKPRTLELTAESGYSINTEDKYLLEVSAGTKPSALLANFKNAENIKLFNANGEDITNTSGNVGTGCTVKLMNGDDAVDSVTVVIMGDVDGNGRIGAFDYMAIRAHLSGTELTGAYYLAADVDGNERIGAFDYMGLRYMLGS